MLLPIQGKIRVNEVVVFGAFYNITAIKGKLEYYYSKRVGFTPTGPDIAPVCPNTTRLIPRPFEKGTVEKNQFAKYKMKMNSLEL